MDIKNNREEGGYSMSSIELLAPAGDLHRLKTAIKFGANAVYIGGKRFSLRSRASNFDLDTIQQAVQFAHERNAKVFVTVNMIPHDEDLDGLDEYLIALNKIGVDAIIVASLAILKRAKELTTGMEVHISTQYSITNAATIEFYKKQGADRVVLARENTLDELSALMQQTSLPIEVFIHGGMCVNYSGRCTLSNYMTLRDANRGGCAQSCRWKYEMFDEDDLISDSNQLFSMSSKDLNAIEVLPDLIRLKVASLKIEGRMKTEYYIATVVSAYRRAIDALNEDHADTDKIISKAIEELKYAENRETFGGFYKSHPTVTGHLYGVNGAGVNQNFIGIVLDYDEETQIAKIQVRNQFTQEDEIEVFGPKTNPESFYPTEMKDSDNILTQRFYKPMEIVTMKIPYSIYKDDFIRKIIK